MRSWTEDVPAIAASRLVMTDRAGRWVTEQVGRHGRTVNEVAAELGCDWHTVNDTVMAYGTALIDDDPERIGQPTALGVDETLFVRVGRWRRQQWSTSIVDAAPGAFSMLSLVAVPQSRAAGWPIETRVAGDPHGEVRTAWHAKEVVRSIYEHHEPDLAVAFVERLGRDLQDESCPIEVRSLGRTLVRWRDQIAAWHRGEGGVVGHEVDGLHHSLAWYEVHGAGLDEVSIGGRLARCSAPRRRRRWGEAVRPLGAGVEVLEPFGHPARGQPGQEPVGIDEGGVHLVGWRSTYREAESVRVMVRASDDRPGGRAGHQTPLVSPGRTGRGS